MQHYVAEESNLHARASQAVRSVSNTGEHETAAKEIRADGLRRFLLLENAALPGTEQGKSYAYTHITNAQREICGHDERLRSRDHNSCNMVTSMVAHSGPARKTSARIRIVITGSQWNHGMMVPTGTTQRDMETNFIPKKPIGTRIVVRRTTMTLPMILFQKTFLHCWINLSKHEGDVNELETVPEAVAAANATADVSRRTWTHATQRTKDAAQIAWLLFQSCKVTK